MDNVDELAQTAERDVAEATLLLERTLLKDRLPSPGQRNDWPDLLLMDLAQDASTEIGAWAEVNGLARETVSRGFATAYGIAPSVLRAELRARAAWLRITRGSDCLCKIAADTGFADQAHMTRWITASLEPLRPLGAGTFAVSNLVSEIQVVKTCRRRPRFLLHRMRV